MALSEFVVGQPVRLIYRDWDDQLYEAIGLYAFQMPHNGVDFVRLTDCWKNSSLHPSGVDRTEYYGDVQSIHLLTRSQYNALLSLRKQTV